MIKFFLIIIKLVVSRIISNIKYLYFSQHINYGKPKKLNNICIFCKGESLKLFENYIKKKQKIDLIILVNFEKNDLLSEKLTLKPLIKNIPIVILGNITEPLLYFENLKGLSLYEVYVQRFKPENFQIKKTSLKGTRTNYRLNAISNNVNYLNNYTLKFYTNLRKSFKNGLRTNCGISSILLACSYMPKKITIFGLDFYESEYFNFKLLDKMDVKEKKMLFNYKKEFKIFVKYIILKHQKIKFNLYTYANLKEDFRKLKNLKIINS